MSPAPHRPVGATARRARRGAGAGASRVRAHAFQVVQCAAAAAAAWSLARLLLGHEQPVFAAIAATLALGVSYGQRRRRVLEVVAGVAVGVLVGDLLVGVVGSGAWQIALVIAVAMSLAIFLGAGTLMTNQAAVQGVFVMTLASTTSAGVGRWLDALIGGLVALLVATLVPASPLRRPLRLTGKLLGELADLLWEATAACRGRDAAAAADALTHARGTQSTLDALGRAAAEGLDVLASSPFRRRHATRVVSVAELSVPLDRAVRNVRVLCRRLQTATVREEEVPGDLLEAVDDLAAACLRLGGDLEAVRVLAPVVEDLEAVASATAEVPRSSLSADVVLAQVRSTVVDLLQVAGIEGDEAAARVQRLTPGS